ncbi:MAG: endonuclease/exonuclease/phosphatase family protein [Spirochaetaceae bacterium]|nr:MAG: endonuclease/exonuclease/phosphatase family protein [Spirochaetaceae bacterium]
MTKIMYILCLASAILIQPDSTAGESKTAGDEIVVGTFNVHYTAPWQEKMIWEERRDAVVKVLREGDADIIGFQEMETFVGGHWNKDNIQLDWVLEHFPGYSVSSIGDPQLYPSTQPILFRKSRFDALDQGFFFFSPDPDRIYAQPWKGRFPAFCSWSRFRDRESGRSFYVYNLHFDYSSVRNRLNSAELAAERIATREHPFDGVIVLGDFNSPRSFPPVRIVERAGLTVAETRGSTFHFNRGINIQPAIDHVLYSDDFAYRSTRVIRDRLNGEWPSDHYPLFVTLALSLESEAQP